MTSRQLIIGAVLALMLAGCASTGGNVPPAPPFPDCQFHWDPTCPGPNPFPPIPPIPRPIPNPPHR